MSVALSDGWTTLISFPGGDYSRTFDIYLNGTTYRGGYYNTGFDFFTDTPAVNDYIQIAFQGQFWGVRLDVSTAFSATSVTFVWEYYSTAGTWKSLPVKNGDFLLSTGSQDIEWIPPSDWGGFTDKGMAVRCRISAVSGATEGGRHNTTRPEFNFRRMELTGTSTIDNAITADKAGTYTILESTTCATNLVPFFMPIDLINRTSTVTATLAGTSAGAGDTLDITGEDIDGNTISESIDVSSGDGAYTSTYSYKKITDIDCTGWSDGTITVDQDRWGMIDNTFASAYKGTYIFGIPVSIGDGSTSTTFSALNDTWNFRGGTWWYANKATVTLTKVAVTEFNDYYGNTGVVRSRDWTSDTELIITDCTYQWQTAFYSSYQVFRLLNIGHTIDGFALMLASSRDYFVIPGVPSSTQNYTGLKITTGTLFYTGSIFETVTINDSAIGGYPHIELRNQIQFNNCTFIEGTGTVLHWFYNASARATYKDCNVTQSMIGIGYSGVNSVDDCVRIAHDFDLRVVDANGDGIDSATVVIVDAEGTEVFNDVTDSSGDIDTQVLLESYADWDTDANVFVWHDATPHTITISKTGYKTRNVIYNVNQKFTAVEKLTEDGTSLYGTTLYGSTIY